MEVIVIIMNLWSCRRLPYFENLSKVDHLRLLAIGHPIKIKPVLVDTERTIQIDCAIVL